MEELQRKGIKAAGVVTDVTCFKKVQEDVSSITTKLGDIDILVANAGGSGGGTVL